MPVEIQTNGRLVINGDALPTTDVAIGDAVSVTPIPHSGLNENDAVIAGGAAPTVFSATIPFEEAFDTLGFVVTNVTALDLYLKVSVGGILQATGKKFSLDTASSAKAVGYITGFNVAQNGPCLATVEVQTFSGDGEDDPVLIATGAIPTVSRPNLYTLGGVTINGVAIPGVTAISCTFAKNNAPQPVDGETYATAGIYNANQPTITITHADPDAVRTALTSEGVGVTTSVVINLKKVTPDTGVVTSVGQKVLTIADGYVAPGGMTAGNGQAATQTLVITPISSDGNASGIVVS